MNRRVQRMVGLAAVALFLPLVGANAQAQEPELSRTQLRFASQAVDTPSEEKLITLKNRQTISLVIRSIEITGDFAQTNDCVGRLKPGASCTIQVIFRPTARAS